MNWRIQIVLTYFLVAGDFLSPASGAPPFALPERNFTHEKFLDKLLQSRSSDRIEAARMIESLPSKDLVGNQEVEKSINFIISALNDRDPEVRASFAKVIEKLAIDYDFTRSVSLLLNLVISEGPESSHAARALMGINPKVVELEISKLDLTKIDGFTKDILSEIMKKFIK